VTDERFPPDDPREWLRRARSNLVRARQRQPDVYFEDLCFDAQQAAEKAVKALLLHMDVRFPYTHDLADLLTLVQQNEQPVPNSVKEAAALSEYAVETRYPGLAEPVTEEEHAEAVKWAERVVQWAKQRVKDSDNAQEHVDDEE